MAFPRLTLIVRSAACAIAINMPLLCATSTVAETVQLPAGTVDPVSAAVAEASRRFSIPEVWIKAVMRQESRGNPAAVSPVGAIGLMQVMPKTYAELRARHGLGTDAFAVRDNILAGTAYLREMHDRYGPRGMLAAYNAGPKRWEDYVRAGRPLPWETVDYLARLEPLIDPGAPPAPAKPITIAGLESFGSPIFVRFQLGLAASVTQFAQLKPQADAALFVRRERAELNAPEHPPTTSGAKPIHAILPLAGRSPTANALFPPRDTGPQR